ncbi:MAG: hypothetical protein ISR65_17195 [Bacteriovoracaceae bacterium]|nr:hypothetical protein [Bacteriovoracaceae bacterium]
MNKFCFNIILLLLILTVRNSFATYSVDVCANQAGRVLFNEHFVGWLSFKTTDLPSLIKQTVRDLFPEELLAVGQVYKLGEHVGPFQNGDYIFLIDHLERLIISPRVPVGQAIDGKYLASHLGLLNKLIQIDAQVVDKNKATVAHTFLTKPMVLAAGEFRVINDTIVSLSNRSGSWRGNQSHLSYALRRLKDAHINFHQNAKIIDQNSKDHKNLDHISVRGLAKIIIEVRGDEHLNTLAQKFSTFYSHLVRRFPSNLPNHFDTNLFRDFLTQNNLGMSAWQDILIPATQFVSDGVERMLHVFRLESDIDLDQFEQSIDMVDKLLNATDKHQ